MSSACSVVAVAVAGGGAGAGAPAPSVARARASAAATSRVPSMARASPSPAVTSSASASSSSATSSSAAPRCANVVSAPSSSGRSRNIVVRLSSGAFTSKYGFSVVAPTKTMTPSSTDGSRTSCCEVLNRWTSSTNSSVRRPCSPSSRAASAMASRASRTPALVALSGTNAIDVPCASSRAIVVLPVPAGPKRRSETSEPCSARTRSAPPWPRRWSWPTTSSRVRGRSRAASGALAASRSRATDSKSPSPLTLAAPPPRCRARGAGAPRRARAPRS